ncbi:alkaline shock response membrane anchor protein AmaP [Streptomyces sp. B8F3]|uniref:alkaline shock response membrane anchor protein AmaP n=1 Tax=unclassified Streptomyces TaxID=2593676 RepID=UPI00325CB1AD
MRQARLIVNRLLLGACGLVLFGFGGTALLGGLDLLHRWHFPDAWPWDRPQQVLLSNSDRTRWRDEGWWWPVVIAALAVILLLTLWWLLAQVRRRRLNQVLVDTQNGETAQVRGRALEDALSAEAGSFPGVDRATTRLVGRRTHPRTWLSLRLAPHADPARTVVRLAEEALPHARDAVGADQLPTEVRLRATSHRAGRVL